MNIESFFELNLKHLVAMFLLLVVFQYYDILYTNSVDGLLGALALTYILSVFLLYFLNRFKVFFTSTVVFFDAGGVFFQGDYFTSDLRIAPHLPELVRAVRKKNLAVMFTNQNREVNKYLISKYGLDNHFDDIISSGDIRLSKPSAAAYKKLLHITKKTPDHAVIIDDKAEYLAGAKEIGMHTIHFTSVHQTREGLKKLGFL